MNFDSSLIKIKVKWIEWSKNIVKFLWLCTLGLIYQLFKWKSFKRFFWLSKLPLIKKYYFFEAKLDIIFKIETAITLI